MTTFITKKTITETFLQRVRTTPNQIGFQFKPTYSEMGEVGEWKTLTFKEFYQQCRIVSFGLMGCGVKKGDRVIILSQTRFEWSLADLAILGAGAVTVPIYSSSTAEDSVYIVNHAEAKVLFVEDSKLLEKILLKMRDDSAFATQVEKIIVFEPSAMGLFRRYPEFLEKAMTLQALREIGKREESKKPQRFDELLSEATPQDLITICYTSGTTGVPKGVMLTHDNLMSVLEDCVAMIGPHIRSENEVVVSFLPFSHIFGKVESLAIYTFGWKCVYAENLEKLMSNIAEVQPTLLFSVPRIFEKAYSRIHAMLDSGSMAKRKVAQWAFEVGRKYYEAIWDKRIPAFQDYIQYHLAKRLVFDQVAQRFGGRLRFAISGGAPLPKQIGEFFQIVGIQVLEGYGLTETCAPVSVNTPGNVRFGTVGKPFPEVSIKIAEDGEILIRSRKVFQAYYKMPEETAQALRGGWFYTGDIGYIDSEGFIRITDRKKDLIVTSGGKNIAPQKIENLAKSQRWITQFVVHGDRRNYLTALVTLDHDQVIQYANENQILFSEYQELIRNQKIISQVQKLIDSVNEKLASFETIKKFVILPQEFSVENGELTPSLKVKRRFVNQKYRAELDAMYAE